MEAIQQFILDHIEWFIAAFAGGTSFFIPMTREIWIIILRAFITKKAIIRIFIHFGDWLVEQIPGTVDDELWADARKALLAEINK